MSKCSWLWTCFFLICVLATVNTLQENDICFTPNRVRGTCIPLNQCPSVKEISERSSLYFNDFIFVRQSACGESNNGPLVCCSDSLSKYSNEGVRQSGISQDNTNLLPTADVCLAEDSDKRIVYGERAQDHPWAVLLNYDLPDNTKRFYCGGFLINERYVLTAAHCVRSTKMERWILSSVRLGEYDISKDDDCDFGKCRDKPVNINVERLIPHENYNSGSSANDIALIRLSRPVQYTDYIKPLCLPLGDKMKSLNLYDNTMLSVAGWGRTENGTYSNVKLKVEVPGVSNSRCQRSYIRRKTISDNHLCAGGINGKDSCSGDSGGALVALDDTDPLRPYWYCAGIVSYGPSACGTVGVPGVYTRVSAYVDWIVRNISA